MYNPVSTYRIQFNKHFTFKDFKAQLNYFALLGPGTIYASPIFAATPESIHGYDVTNPLEFNSEIGNENEFDVIIQALKENNIGWIQDIVPNHMALHSDNQWLMDVLKKGIHSKYAKYFDIDFSHPDFKGKLMIPFLGKKVEDALQQGEIRLNRRGDILGFTYFDYFFPLSEETEMPLLTAKENSLDEIISYINSDLIKLQKLFDNQHYQLSYWQEAERHLNDRRFFTINSLICLRMENKHVFNDYHTFIAKLLSDNKIHGLRIDHIDGLREPTRYLERLRALVGNEIYIVVEKILGRDEKLVPDWPLQGTTGYDFLSIVNNLFTYEKNYPVLQKFYQELTGITNNPEDIIYQKKKIILSLSMQGEWDNLFRMFNEADFIAYTDPDITPENMKNAIGEFLLAFPIYKLYSQNFPLTLEDQIVLRSVIHNAGERDPLLKKSLNVIYHLFIDQKGLTEEKKTTALQFYLRCLQFTGPLMAKGVEDTVMYYYNCFIAHNEVGDATDARGISIKEFHEAMLFRWEMLPMTLNTTSTHDTKRSEDVRARLNLISELPTEWIKIVKQWVEINRVYKLTVNEIKAPSLNEEYFIYQLLIGIYPFGGKADETLPARLDEYLVKALREAKVSSNWNQPDDEYEKAVLNFTRRILEPGRDFMKLFLPFQQRIEAYGSINSLSQLMLKATCPGIPDFYQGTEFWDLSMVDPDNRRSVDYGQRYSILKDLISRQQEHPDDFLKNLYLHRENGQIKLWLTHLLMKERSLDPNLFIHAQYIPLLVSGKYEEHILTYVRIYKNTWYLVIIPLYPSILYEKMDTDVDHNVLDWGDTRIELPVNAPAKWINILEAGQTLTKGYLLVSGTLKFLCPCLMKGTTEEK